MFGITNPTIQIPRFLPLLWPATSYWKLNYSFPTTLPHDIQKLIFSFLLEPHFFYKAFEWQYNSVLDPTKLQIPCTDFLTGNITYATSKPPTTCFIIFPIPFEHILNQFLPHAIHPRIHLMARIPPPSPPHQWPQPPI